MSQHNSENQHIQQNPIISQTHPHHQLEHNNDQNHQNNQQDYQQQQQTNQQHQNQNQQEHQQHPNQNQYQQQHYENNEEHQVNQEPNQQPRQQQEYQHHQNNEQPNNQEQHHEYNQQQNIGESFNQNDQQVNEQNEQDNRQQYDQGYNHQNDQEQHHQQNQEETNQIVQWTQQNREQAQQNVHQGQNEQNQQIYNQDGQNHNDLNEEQNRYHEDHQQRSNHQEIEYTQQNQNIDHQHSAGHQQQHQIQHQQQHQYQLHQQQHQQQQNEHIEQNQNRQQYHHHTQNNYNNDVVSPSPQYFEQQQNIDQINRINERSTQTYINRMEQINQNKHSDYYRQPYAVYHNQQMHQHIEPSPVDQSRQDLDLSAERQRQLENSNIDASSNTQNSMFRNNNTIIQERSQQSESLNNSSNASGLINSQNQSQKQSILLSTNSVNPPLVPPVVPQVQEQSKQTNVGQIQVPPHDDFQVMILPPEGLEPQTIGNMYSSAFEQRRQINRKLMMSLFDKRNAYYLTHVAVFDHIRLGLRLRIKNSRQGIESFKQFFKEQISVYNDVINSMKNVVELRNKTQTDSLKVHWSEGVTQGIYKNIEDQNEIVEMMISYKSLTDQNFTQQIEQAYRDYERTLQSCQKVTLQTKKQFTKFQQKIIDMQKDIHKKFKKEQKYPDKKSKGYDLAEQEVILFRQMKVCKDKLSKWGATVIEWWNEQISEQIKLLTRIKQLINNFVDLTNKIHVISSHIRNRSSAWNLESVEQDVLINYQFENIVCLTDIDFVRGSLETYNRLPRPDKISIKDIETFNMIQYQERIMGKRDIIIDCLIVKQFKCKRMIPGKQQLQRVRVVATIDDNLLIIDFEEKTICSKLKQLMNTRPEANVVKINYKKKGWFIDDWESVFLQFKSQDKAEEFMFFTETNSQAKNEYVV